MQDTGFIGQRLRQVRTERGYSREQLAGRAGISARYIAKIERGNDGVPSIPAMLALAAALGVPPSRLLDKHEQFQNGSRGHGTLLVRDALLAPGDLPGIGDFPEGEALSMVALERAVDGCWQAYWSGQFGLLAGLLPDLLTSARATERELGTAACRPLAQAFQLAADLMVHVGNDDLAFAAAMRAIAAAHRGDDPLQHATLAGTASWVLLHQNRLEEAEKVAAAGAGLAEPRFPRAPRDEAEAEAQMAHLTVYGALLLSAAAPAAATGNADAVADYMSTAQVTTLRFTAGDRHDYHVSFGPTQLAMQRTHTMTVLGKPADALKTAKRVVRADLLPISWGAHHLDKAQANVAMGRASGAVDALWEAHQVSAEWARHQGPWRDLVEWAARREHRTSQRMVRLTASAGVR